MPVPMIMNNLFIVIAFYVNLLVLMPKFFNKKGWIIYVLFTCVFLAGSIFIHTLAMEVDLLFGQKVMMDMGHDPRPPRGFEFRQFSFIFMFAMVWALSMTYYLFVQLQESVQHTNKVRAAALQSELSFLKAQVNPHFLFNTLNNIYALTLKKSEDAPIAVMKLSNLMRKITNDTGVDFVRFEEEESFIRDYIELQKLRLTDKTHVNYLITGDYNSLQIAPRVLIPFIDNAFKYGVSNRYESEIKIQFEFRDKTLFFTIQNAIHPNGGESIESSGVGLDNAKRRLALLYQDKHTLKITKTPESYTVLLKIELA
jgi:Putative regulator of cell autolysis